MATSSNAKQFSNSINNQCWTKFKSTQGHSTTDQLYASIGVKSHGTITCMINKTYRICLLLMFLFLLVSDNGFNRAEFVRVPADASMIHLKKLLIRQWCHGVSHRITQSKKNVLSFLA